MSLTRTHTVRETCLGKDCDSEVKFSKDGRFCKDCWNDLLKDDFPLCMKHKQLSYNCPSCLRKAISDEAERLKYEETFEKGLDSLDEPETPYERSLEGLP